MGLNISKLKKLQKGIKSKAGKGDDLFLYSNKIGEEMFVRILPSANLEESYFVEEVIWWINGKQVQSEETWGEPCVIQAIIDEARDKGDADLDALLNAKKGVFKVLKKETRYLVPILEMDIKFDDNDNMITQDVVSARVLAAKPTLMVAINAVVTSRPFQNGTDNGIADRVKGNYIILGKDGKGKSTTYAAQGWNTANEMDEKHYTDKAIPNVLKIITKNRKSIAAAESIINNYLYGDDIIEDDKVEEAEEAPKTAAPRQTTRRAAAPPVEPETKQPKTRRLLDDAKEATAGDFSIEDAELDDLD